jgi:hypothetical protein
MKGFEMSEGGYSEITPDATTLCLVAHPTSINPASPPPQNVSATDVITVVDDLFDATDKKVGHDEIVCVAVNTTDLQCSGTIFLPKGQLTFTMPYSLKTRSGEGAITGGTNAYQGAGGTFKAVARPDVQPMVSDYTLKITNL